MLASTEFYHTIPYRRGATELIIKPCLLAAQISCTCRATWFSSVQLLGIILFLRSLFQSSVICSKAFDCRTAMEIGCILFRKLACSHHRELGALWPIIPSVFAIRPVRTRTNGTQMGIVNVLGFIELSEYAPINPLKKPKRKRKNDERNERTGAQVRRSRYGRMLHYVMRLFRVPCSCLAGADVVTVATAAAWCGACRSRRPWLQARGGLGQFDKDGLRLKVADSRLHPCNGRILLV